jgi:hypothetical protein
VDINSEKVEKVGNEKKSLNPKEEIECKRGFWRDEGLNVQSVLGDKTAKRNEM